MPSGRRNQWGEWSEWFWDENNGRHCRARQDIRGKVEYEYEYPDTAGQTAPRGNADDLAAALSSVNLDGQDATYTTPDGYTYSAPVASPAVAQGASHTAPVVAYGSYPGQSKGKGVDRSVKPKSKGHKEPNKEKSSSSRKQGPNPGTSHGQSYAEDPQEPFYSRKQKSSDLPNSEYAPSDAAFIDSSPASDPRLGTLSQASAFASGLSSSPATDYGYDQSPPLDHSHGAEYPDQEHYSRRGHASGRGTKLPAHRPEDSTPAEYGDKVEFLDDGKTGRHDHASYRGTRLPTYLPEDPLPVDYRGEVDFPEEEHGRRSHPSDTRTRRPTYDPEGPPPDDYRGEADVPGPGRYNRRSHASGRRETRRPSSGTEDLPPRQPTSGYYASAPPVDPQDSLNQDEPNEQLQALLSQANPYDTGAPSSSYLGGGASSMATAHSYQYDLSDGLGSGQRTPTQFMQPMTEIADQYASSVNAPAGPGVGQDPANGFIVERSSRFMPGEVFKIFWSEPLGASGTPRSVVMTDFVGMQGHNGQQFYQGFRRFIVVANDEGNCTCVPILTYEHQACTKRGVKPLKHGIVHQHNKSPRMVNKEPALGFPPVRVKLYEKTEKLDKESRINYAKLSTIEHNFRVFFIGSVLPEDFNAIVGPAVDECWRRKKRHH